MTKWRTFYKRESKRKNILGFSKWIEYIFFMTKWRTFYKTFLKENHKGKIFGGSQYK